MSYPKSNNIYICNLDRDVKRFDKQFHHSVTPSNMDMSISEVPTQTKYDNHIYTRGADIVNEVKNVDINTSASQYAKNIRQETVLQSRILKNNDCNFNSYVPSKKSDLYTLNTSIKKEKGPHDLLFQIPNFSCSSTPPIITGNVFNNFTREERNSL
jgi:hypothetical protein